MQPKRKILLVDDDTSLLLTLGDFLRFEGYEVVTADCGEEGLEKLRALAPDLIIMDISMPGMGGPGFLKAIGSPEGPPRYPVLVLTARAQMAEPFGNIGVDGFIVKPCDPADLLAEVNRIVFLRRGHPETGGTGSRRVLLGENDDAAAADLTAALDRSPFLLERVRNGPDLLERAVQSLPSVIVIKTALGNMNGDAVAAMLQEIPETSGIPVILYDRDDTQIPESRYASAAENIQRLVRKATPADIRMAVEEVVEG